MHDPFITLIEESPKWSESLIIVPGYRSNYGLTSNLKYDWKWSLREAGWKGSIHYLWWDSPRSLPDPLHWKQMKDRAKRVGSSYFSNLVSFLPSKSVSLIGYSLGAYVAHYAMRSWLSSKLLNNVVLLGGAVGRKKEWEEATLSLAGQLVNVYNSQDPALLVGYLAGELIQKSSPCGLKPIEKFHPKISNIDATSLVGHSHDEVPYLDAVRQIVGQRLWAY